MEELKFKTTLKCGGCEEKITEGLNAIEEIEQWEVDLDSAEKTLTITASENVEAKVKAVFKAKGFEAVKV